MYAKQSKIICNLLLSIIIILIFNNNNNTYAELISQCPDVYKYVKYENNSAEWIAEITIKSDTEIYGVMLDISLNKPADTLINWYAQSISKDNILFTLSDDDKLLKKDETLIVKILVKFDATNVPEIDAIRFNGKNICGVFKNITRTTTTTTTTTTVRPLVPKQHPRIIKPLNAADDIECGKIPLRGQPFIRKGINATIEDWPWHTAIYQWNGTDSSYICGGTLISKDYVLTAAHCTTELGTELPKRFEELLLYMGTTNLKEFGPHVQIHQVSRIHVHPLYSGRNFRNDLSVIRLNYSVRFNEKIWPACLWSDDVQIDKYYGYVGTVVGWGRDETNQLSLNLIKLNLPVISLSNCLSSDRLFFASYITENNYCAGYKNGSSVCSGDSGGGMFFIKSNTIDTWQIRGIVSVGAVLPGTLICHPSHYSIFTDVAKYLDWIKNIIND